TLRHHVTKNSSNLSMSSGHLQQELDSKEHFISSAHHDIGEGGVSHSSKCITFTLQPWTIIVSGKAEEVVVFAEC
ncbi:MAG: hypothetical protein ACK53Y_05225, partial [bacterium]